MYCSVRADFPTPPLPTIITLWITAGLAALGFDMLLDQSRKQKTDIKVVKPNVYHYHSNSAQKSTWETTAYPTLIWRDPTVFPREPIVLLLCATSNTFHSLLGLIYELLFDKVSRQLLVRQIQQKNCWIGTLPHGDTLRIVLVNTIQRAYSYANTIDTASCLNVAYTDTDHPIEITWNEYCGR